MRRARALMAGIMTLQVGALLGACASTPPSKTRGAIPAAQLDLASKNLHPPLQVSLPDEPVVRVVGPDSTCSGTLIADNEVLTAHHCVVQRNAHGRALAADLRPDEISVELGGDYLPWGTVKVRALVAPPCGYNAGHGDIAILILNRHLRGARTMTPRIDRGAQLGEGIDPVGFGHCAESPEGVRRVRRAGGTIEQIGSSMLFATTAMCPGDSGGPAKSLETGEVIGIVSAGVMDASAQTVDPSIYTRLDVWRGVFANAQQIALGTPPAEVPPLDDCDSTFDFSAATPPQIIPEFSPEAPLAPLNPPGPSAPDSP